MQEQEVVEAGSPSETEVAAEETTVAAAETPAAEAPAEAEAAAAPEGEESEAVEMTAEEVLSTGDSPDAPAAADEAARTALKAVIEGVIYITDEPLSPQQIAMAVQQPMEIVKPILDELVAEYSKPEHGVTVREVAGGFKMATKPEHHEAIRTFVKNLKPPLKLSLAALETLAVIAYKQPITAPEIMEIRGVAGAGVLKTLLDRKLIATAGRKNIVGKPILYKTTKEFLVQFGLKDLSELPTLKEFEELGRLALSDDADLEPVVAAEAEPQTAEASEEPATEGGEAPETAGENG
jgi:segregation and condensation protein B